MVSVRIVDGGVSHDPEDIVLQTCNCDSTATLCLAAIEKKVRGLEKKKTKLDSHKQKLALGEKLMKEQMDALDKYELVAMNLEFAKEMHSQVQEIAVETERSQESTTKPCVEQNAAHKISTQDIEDILTLQFAVESIKQTHSGQSDDQDESDELRLISQFGDMISLDDKVSHDRLHNSAVHLHKYVAREHGTVAGTTYNNIFHVAHKFVDNLRASKNSSMPSATPQQNAPLESNDVHVLDRAPTFLVSNPELPSAKPLLDILKGMEGEFSFLQESEVYKETQVEAQAELQNANVTTTTEVVAPSYAINAHPLGGAVFVPKGMPDMGVQYLTIPYTNALYASPNTIPVTHQYTVSAFTSYDYNIQEQLPFQMYHPAIINGTTYFQQPGTVYAPHQPAGDAYIVPRVEEFADGPDVSSGAAVYYAAPFDVNLQPQSYRAQIEERPTDEFESTSNPRVAASPSSSARLQPAGTDPTIPLSSPQSSQGWHFSGGRGRGGRGNSWGPRSFHNQSRFHRNRDEDQGGYRGSTRGHRFYNGNSPQHQQQQAQK